MPASSRRLTAFVIAVVVLAVAPLAVVAADTFTDVPDSNVFHDDIAWLADAGVTKGCNPPANTQFCPSDEVTREQMAAFMHRLAENQVVDAATAVEADTLDGEDGAFYESILTGSNYDFTQGTGNIALSTTAAGLLETTIVAPADGIILASASASVGNNTNDLGFFIIWLELDDGSCQHAGVTPSNAIVGSMQYHAASVDLDDFGMSIDGIASVEAGSHTITLCALQSGDSGDAFSATVVAQFAGQGEVTSPAIPASATGAGPEG